MKELLILLGKCTTMVDIGYRHPFTVNDKTFPRHYDCTLVMLVLD
jgi:hypothetical protein